MLEFGKGIAEVPHATAEQLLAAIARATSEALQAHKDAGNSVVFWDRERVQIVEVAAEDIVVPDPRPASGARRSA